MKYNGFFWNVVGAFSMDFGYKNRNKFSSHLTVDPVWRFWHIYLFIYTSTHWGRGTRACQVLQKSEDCLLSPSTIWIPRTKLRLSNLATISRTHWTISPAPWLLHTSLKAAFLWLDTVMRVYTHRHTSITFLFFSFGFLLSSHKLSHHLATSLHCVIHYNRTRNCFKISLHKLNFQYIQQKRVRF